MEDNQTEKKPGLPCKRCAAAMLKGEVIGKANALRQVWLCFACDATESVSIAPKQNEVKPRPLNYVPVKPKPNPIQTMEEIEQLGLERFNQPKDRALYYLTYLTGGRVSEVLTLRRRDVYHQAGVADTVTVDLPTRKNRKFQQALRRIPIPTNGKEGLMVAKVLEYTESLEPWAPLFPMHRATVFKLFKRKLKVPVSGFEPVSRTPLDLPDFWINPHFLRHCRLTHLVDYYGFDPMRLQYFAGWSSVDLANTYVKLSWRSLRDAMK